MPSIIPAIQPPSGAPTVTAPIWLDQDTTVQAGATVFGVGIGTMLNDVGFPKHNLTNAGTIWSRGQSTITLSAPNFGTITNTGTMVSEATQGQANTIAIGSQLGGLINSGSIYAIAHGGGALATADSDIYAFGSTITNSGVIAAQSDQAAYAVRRGNGGYINNQASGAILAEGADAVAVMVGRGHAALQPGDPAEIINAGRIEAVSTDPAHLSYAIFTMNLESERMTIVNSGTLRGDYAIYISSVDPSNPEHSTQTVINSGVIDGDVYLALGNDVVFNSGTIIGTVSLGGDRDFYMGSAGEQHGAIHGDAGDDILSGYGAGTLDGGAGDDVLVNHGAETMTGGTGRDTFVIAGVPTGAGWSITDFVSGTDRLDLTALSPSSVALDASGGNTTVTVTSAAGNFVIHVTGTVAQQDVIASDIATIDGTANADALMATAHGSTLHGLGGDDLLIGMGGNDTLDGGTGADQMIGGAGNDTYVIDSRTDNIIELPGGGYDTIVNLSGGAIEMDDNVEALTGGSGYGNALDNVMTGSGGDDLLDGGTGADNMAGGAGNDTYWVDQAGDTVYESPTGGIDTIVSTADVYLVANVENLTLWAAAGNIYGVGNDLDNVITGSYYNNLLLGGGGADTMHGSLGTDVVYGQDGDDRLFGDGGNDVLVGGIGNDTMDGGVDGDSLYGEDGDDVLWGGTDFTFDQLVGGAGNDVLHGDSGEGDFDYLIGNAGNDSYYVDTPADLVFESAGEGTDTVYAKIAGTGYYLYANIENLVLLGNTPYGVGNELANHMTGNDAANWLLGGAGDDVLDGKGGNDVLFGQDGADIFVFGQGTGGDTIADFVAGTDRIDLSAFGFASFAQVQAAMVENGGTTAINLGGGDFIVLNGVANAALHTGDFILTGGSAAEAPAEQRVSSDAGDADTPLGRWGLTHQFDVPHLIMAGGVLSDYGAHL